MKLTVFGNNATCPEADGACSSFLVEAGPKKILLDMGNGSLAKIRQKVDLADLDIIIISHLHFDHFGDLFCAKYHLETRKAYGEEIHKILLLIPKLPDWAASELSTNDVFEIHTISDGYSFVFDSIEINFTELVHLIESYGVRIQAGGKTLAYSGDTGICDAVNAVAANADVFLCEATFCSKSNAEEKHHLSSKTAATVACDAGVKKLLLTHFHSNQREMIHTEARKYFDHVTLTEIGGTYAIE